MTKRTRLLAALAVVVAATLTAPQGACALVQHLDAGVRHVLLTAHFRAVRHVADIPPAVMEAAGHARGSPGSAPLELADPGKPFQSTDVITTPNLPGRRLIAAYTSSPYWAMFYEVGGIAHTFHVAVFHIDGKRVHFVWHADLRPNVSSLETLRTALRDPNTKLIDDTYRQFY